MSIFHHIWLWWLTVTGSNNTSGVWYGFWSGFGSDLGEIAIIASIIGWYKHNECHVDSCHRLGKHPFRHYKLCKHHHPGVPDKLTHLQVIKLHKQDQEYER